MKIEIEIEQVRALRQAAVVLRAHEWKIDPSVRPKDLDVVISETEKLVQPEKEKATTE